MSIDKVVEVQVLSDDQVYARQLKGWKAILVQPQAKSEEGGGEEGQEGVEQEADEQTNRHTRKKQAQRG